MMDEIKTIGLQDKNYPRLLTSIKNPPPVLYYRGELKPQEICFAIVGTRMCSPYGKEAATEFAGDLSEAGLTIVSGLAPGIDTYSHLAVVEKSKRTIAVLGTGLDTKSIYPQSNLALTQKILTTGGCLLSEYPEGTPGSKITFPQRNRIISGLSSGVLVVEAKQKSGSLITARWAQKQNRKVFAVPGQIYSLNSKGCHYLIKHGAFLAESANDILEELNILESREVAEASPHLPPRPSWWGSANETENLILQALMENALEIDKIIEKTNLSAQKIAATLAILEIKDKVRNLGGNIYALSHR